MSSQPTLFDVGRAQLPPRVIAFASGANEAREIRGFALAGVPVGVSVDLVREKAILELVRSELPIFADSGAFPEIRITSEGPVVVRPINDNGWQRRLAVYLRLARVQRDRLYVVAPDRVADQEYTVRLLHRYAPKLREIAACGSHILLPVQRGSSPPAEFFLAASRTAAGVDLVPALPMKKAAMSHAEVLHFVDTVAPRRLHLLGMGYERRVAKLLVRRLLQQRPGLALSLDSNRLRAVTGRNRRLTLAERRMRECAPDGVYADVEHEALQTVGERLDYTDLIGSPSLWADESTLRDIAAEAFIDAGEGKAFLADPDRHLQRERGGSLVWECPLVAAALDRAWLRWITGRAQTAVRTAAISEVFAGAAQPSFTDQKTTSPR